MLQKIILQTAEAAGSVAWSVLRLSGYTCPSLWRVADSGRARGEGGWAQWEASRENLSIAKLQAAAKTGLSVISTIFITASPTAEFGRIWARDARKSRVDINSAAMAQNADCLRCEAAGLAKRRAAGDVLSALPRVSYLPNHGIYLM